MITHVVFFKLRDRSPGELEKARKLLLSLEGKVPEMRGLEVGVDLLRLERSYCIALVARFENLQGLEAYRKNPEHVKVADHMKKVSESIASVDYES